jgi:hypothetical protein
MLETLSIPLLCILAIQENGIIKIGGANVIMHYPAFNNLLMILMINILILNDPIPGEKLDAAISYLKHIYTLTKKLITKNLNWV